MNRRRMGVPAAAVVAAAGLGPGSPWPTPAHDRAKLVIAACVTGLVRPG